MINHNLKTESACGKENVVFYDTADGNFGVYGVSVPTSETGQFLRMPGKVADPLRLHVMKGHTAGGRIRFVTDSTYVIVRCELIDMCRLLNMTRGGSMGFDIYEDETYAGTYFSNDDAYDAICEFNGKRERALTLNMPLCSGVKYLRIGLEAGASVRPAEPYERGGRIVYYGSSITQGVGASRPGMSYEAIICRRLGCDYLNLGFAGAAKGEPEMADYIASLGMSAFVLDYDHNAPTVEHLAATHKPLFDKVRAAHPDIPIIMVSRPTVYFGDDVDARFEVIKRTYDSAVSSGDGNVYLVDGRKFAPADCLNDITVDGCHPTDLGFYFMARAIGDVLEKVI